MAPKGQIALKFPADGSIVRIKKIEWSSEGGQSIVPVAIFDPVLISDAMVRRASLKSARWLQDSGVGVGSLVKVVRSGDVIPKIETVISTLESKVEFPSICDHCGSSVGYTEPGGAHLSCSNEYCFSKEASRINVFLQTVSVKGLAYTSLLPYTRNGITILDFVAKNSDHLIEISARISASVKIMQKVVDQLREARVSNLPAFLGAISIPGAGESSWRKAGTCGYTSIDKIILLSYNQLVTMSTDGKLIFGTRGAQVYDALSNARFQELLRHYSKWAPVESQKSNKTSNLKVDVNGKFVCMTGSAPLPRKEIEGILIDAGASVQNEVNSRTNILLIEDVNSTSSKAKSARKLGVTILQYKDVI